MSRSFDGLLGAVSRTDLSPAQPCWCAICDSLSAVEMNIGVHDSVYMEITDEGVVPRSGIQEALI